MRYYHRNQLPGSLWTCVSLNLSSFLPFCFINASQLTMYSKLPEKIKLCQTALHLASILSSRFLKQRLELWFVQPVCPSCAPRKLCFHGSYDEADTLSAVWNQIKVENRQLWQLIKQAATSRQELEGQRLWGQPCSCQIPARLPRWFGASWSEGMIVAWGSRHRWSHSLRLKVLVQHCSGKPENLPVKAENTMVCNAIKVHSWSGVVGCLLCLSC